MVSDVDRILRPHYYAWQTVRFAASVVACWVSLLMIWLLFFAPLILLRTDPAHVLSFDLDLVWVGGVWMASLVTPLFALEWGVDFVSRLASDRALIRDYCSWKREHAFR